MKIDELTIGEAKELARLFSPSQVSTTSSPSFLLNQHVLVRTYSAGVHLGILRAKEGEGVLLEKARRLWKWNGAFTLSEVAQEGVKKDGTRIAMEVPWIELTNANEIIPTSEKARASFEKCRE